MHLRFSRTPLFVKVVLTLLIVLPLFIPVNFVLVQPGPATNLFPKLLSIKSSDAQTYPARGGAFLLTIYVSNPDASILGFQALTCWAEATCVAMPRSVFYKKNTTSEAEYKIGKKDMKKSQSAALSASKALIARHYPAINLSRVSDSSIKIGLKNTGGPSGGLIFSLGLIELLSPDDLLQGRKIAATGTISPDGKVGPIGGIQEKIIGAKKVGASLLLVSRENCDELPPKVEGIDVVAVSTLEEAYTYLLEGKALASSTVRGCTNLGA